jgi:hypothetical protein
MEGKWVREGTGASSLNINDEEGEQGLFDGCEYEDVCLV